MLSRPIGVPVFLPLFATPKMQSGSTAMPPDVRRRLCPAVRCTQKIGRCPGSGSLGTDLTGGIAPSTVRVATAGRSHRRTSGGKAGDDDACLQSERPIFPGKSHFFAI
jgi:hypothetical protein